MSTIHQIPPRGRKRSIGGVDDLETKTTTINTNTIGSSSTLAPSTHAPRSLSTSRHSMKQIKDTMSVKRARVIGTAGERGIESLERFGPAGVSNGFDGSFGRSNDTNSTSTSTSTSASAKTAGTRISSFSSSSSTRAIPIPQPSLFYEPEQHPLLYGISASGLTSTDSGKKNDGNGVVGSSRLIAGNGTGRGKSMTGGSGGKAMLFPHLFSATGAKVTNGLSTSSKIQSKYSASGPLNTNTATHNEVSTRPPLGSRTNFIPASALISNNNLSATNPLQSKPTKPLVAKRPPPSPASISSLARPDKRLKTSEQQVGGIPAPPIPSGTHSTHKNIKQSINTAANMTTTTAVKQSSAEMHAEYRMKYTKAWPGFTFHFDGAMDEVTVRGARERVKRLGGHVEEFFSRKVTHFITNRGPPSATNSAKKSHPLANASVSMNTTRGGGGGGVGLDFGPELGAGVNGSLAGGGSKGGKLLSPFKGGGMTGDGGGGMLSLTMKAQQMNMKVWSMSKLLGILDSLLPQNRDSPAKSRGKDLSYLLKDERLHGTKERDLTAKRHDWYYFPSKSGYLLVEDATGEHRPIMAKQYDATVDLPQPWPMMFETFMKPSENVYKLSRSLNLSPGASRERAWRLYVDRKAVDGQKPPAVTGFGGTGGLMEKAIGGSLNRTSSLANLRNRAQAEASKVMREESLVPYQGASGNTVALTSNVASTSTAMSSARQNHVNTTGVPGVAPGGDKRILNLSKRVQLLKGNVANQMALEQSKIVALQQSHSERKTTTGESVSFAADDEDFDDLEITDEPERESFESASSMLRSNSSSSSSDDSQSNNMAKLPTGGQSRMDLYVREVTLAVLRKAKQAADITDEDWEWQEKMREQGLRPEEEYIPKEVIKIDLKPGYCENCKVKYEGFDEHVLSRRHVRFAEDDANFQELDDLLARLPRPDLCDIRNEQEAQEEEVEDDEDEEMIY